MHDRTKAKPGTPMEFDGVAIDADAIENLRRLEAAKYTEDYFKNDYWKEDIPGKVGNRGLSYNDPEHAYRFRTLLDELGPFIVGSKILDAGCGTGLFVELANNAGMSCIGADISSAAVEKFHQRTQNRLSDSVVVSSLAELPFDSRAFETAVCLDVLEHLLVFDIFKAASELRRTTARRIILSINLDNPYEFHPTILSRSTWLAIFEGDNSFRFNAEDTERLSDSLRRLYVEYDFFIFDRVCV